MNRHPLSRSLSLFFPLLLFICFLPPFSPAFAQPHDGGKGATPYYVEISITGRMLTLYEKREGEAPVQIRQYPVGTVAIGNNTYPTGEGKVTRIEFDPWWHPTPYSRQIFRGRGIVLPPAVPPGDPLNYMGPVKISLSHKTWKGAIYRIHGNNNPNRVGRRVTGGCFVMHNRDGLELARTIKVGTVVNIIP
ncbi:L,D-transpeptidase [Geomonas sp. RF6]|uniref:L,D-transpeptidase n=1 Tax=Geomonas sp. RF6 TaxID=2897342 RepID=UPI001E478048|nr:L,D-transpeptidase [Geomonas sp. RF6]UFS69409.1 L,D-transpeptidase [Geomonas sp. RF6]